MKILKLFTSISAAFIITQLITPASWAESPIVTIDSTVQPDPLTLNGTSGGSRTSNCGHISATPNQVIQVTKPIPYLRLTVKSDGQPTLLIDGPTGRFCVQADSYSGGKAELSGYWQPGKYSLSVGEVSNKQYSYNLSISQQQK